MKIEEHLRTASFKSNLLVLIKKSVSVLEQRNRILGFLGALGFVLSSPF